VQAAAFQALRRLGFGEGETRRALSEVLTHVGQKPNLGTSPAQRFGAAFGA
jgi:hypothetical protein